MAYVRRFVSLVVGSLPTEVAPGQSENHLRLDDTRNLTLAFAELHVAAGMASVVDLQDASETD